MKSILLLSALSTVASANLVRNGTFEGSLLYWHNMDPRECLVTGGKVGPQALRIPHGTALSAPMILQQGETYTISLWAKAEQAGGRIGVGLCPSAREEAVNAHRLWRGDSTKIAKLTTEWRRYHFTWKADVAQTGFWSHPHYMVSISEDNTKVPLLVDGVTVLKGEKTTEDYVPRAPVEVLCTVDNVPSYLEHGGIFPAGADVKITSHLRTFSKGPGKVKLTTSLCDYEGKQVYWTESSEVALPADTTTVRSAKVALPAKGCLLARVTAEQEGKIIDQSAIPVTSLAYPKAATKPDYRERFGGSFAGGLGMVKKFQQIGFGWVRWRPHGKWQDIQPKGPEDFVDFTAILEEQESHGLSSHICLYGWPEWIMEKEHSGAPLPKDMRWPADDARWLDDSVETAWDKYVKRVVRAYRNRSVVFEIENEPEFDKWEKHTKEYALFTARTARIIKQIHPKAQVMVNNVYGIPSGINGHLFSLQDGLKHVDVISWHNYGGGWLADERTMKSFRTKMDAAGGKHVQIWFNEGWSYTNTAVDEPPAIGQSSQQNSNDILGSVVECTATGQEKTILFHTGYEKHGMSFWDYSGPGTMLWDWYNNPLPLVGMWNVLNHHIGLSEAYGLVRLAGCTAASFHNIRTDEGVTILYADRTAKTDVTVELPEAFRDSRAEDTMGNQVTISKNKVIVPQSGRLIYLIKPGAKSGAAMQEGLKPLDRKFQSFVETGSGGAVYRLPASWDGETGTTILAEGKPLWKLEQVWPADTKLAANFRPMTWTGSEWGVKEGGFGGQPTAVLQENRLELATRAPHGTPQAPRWTALTFVAPKSAEYLVQGNVKSVIWDGNNDTSFVGIKKSTDGTTSKAFDVTIKKQVPTKLPELRVSLAAGEELALVPKITGAFAGGSLNLSDFSIAESAGAKTGPIVKLPASWEGANPILANGKPVWRLDQLLPGADTMLPASYQPLTWSGSEWKGEVGNHGGQPAANLKTDHLNLSLAGPWQGKGVDHQKLAILVFIPPMHGDWTISAKLSGQKWTGSAKTIPFILAKRDPQRVATLTAVEVPTDGASVALKAEVNLSGGHELLLMPQVPHHNNALNLSISELEIKFSD
jgi:hypothetical protein